MATGLLPDLIVMDVHLPNQSGWALLRELMTIPDTSEIPVGVLSDDPLDHNKAGMLGVAHVLVRPLDLTGLLNYVERLLHRQVARAD